MDIDISSNDFKDIMRLIEWYNDRYDLYDDEENELTEEQSSVTILDTQSVICISP